jgi:hypothetical protein
MIQNLRDCSVLLLCLGERWGAREQRVFRDALYLKAQKVQVYLVCAKDSALELHAKKNKIELLQLKGPGARRSQPFRFYFEFSKLLKKYQINIVHSYEFRYLWPQLISLWRFPLISFHLSLFNQVRPSRAPLWRGLLTRRIDKVLIPIPEINEIVAFSLMVNQRQVKQMGLGLWSSDFELDADALKNFKERIDLKPNDQLIGVGVSSDLEEMTNVEPLLRSIPAILSESSESASKKNLKFVLVTRRPWDQFLLRGPVTKLIEELELSSCVYLYDNLDLYLALGQFSVWIGLRHDRAYTHDDLMALSMGIPCLIPRTLGHGRVLRLSEGAGLSYKRENAREFRSNLLKILGQLRKFTSQAKALAHQLNESESEKLYFLRLEEVYLDAYTKRRRFFRKFKAKDA